MGAPPAIVNAVVDALAHLGVTHMGDSDSAGSGLGGAEGEGGGGVVGGYKTPITIAQAIDDISHNRYVLPAIQREFVWRPEQITALFDSLMRGYPISTFLFWKVEPPRVGDFKFYKFLDDYHGRDKRHNDPWKPASGSQGVTAVLDGQQRLTALNIGLRGSYAWKRKWGRWRSDHAWPPRWLYLNLKQPAKTKTDVEDKYDFRFLTLTAEQATEQNRRNDQEHWFHPSWLLPWKDLTAVMEYIHQHSLWESRHSIECLSRLFSVIHQDRLISYYEETEQDIEKVLNIFIRVNSGGTVLSYSDLLLSMATAAFTKVDARDEIHGCVDELNKVGRGFAFNKDLVLKSCLVLTGVPGIGFKVRNFTADNMARIESEWSKTRGALRTAAILLSRMGYDLHTLTASSVLIPIAHYVYQRGLTEHHIRRSGFEADASAIRDWTRRALLKRGTFGAGLDTTLRKARETIDEKCRDGFSSSAMDAAFASVGRPLRFVEEELDDLLDGTGGTAFSVLALLFPDFDLTNKFHVDHVFPQARFTVPQFRKAKVAEEHWQDYKDRRDRVANLQFLTESENLEKGAKLPALWLLKHRRGHELGKGGDLHDLPDGMVGFLEWYEARRERMKTRLAELLGVTLGSGMAVEEAE